MLVLSRKQHQAIVINDNIRGTVVSIRGNQVRIGIEAPQSVPVFREELCDPLPTSDVEPRLATALASNRRGTGEMSDPFRQPPLRHL